MNTQIQILYIDDDPILLDVAKQFHERAGGWIVTPVKSAANAILLLSERSFDAIVSDNPIQYSIQVMCR
ncbi:MAG TPA: hypothetical protein VN372_15270 [Methanospirillum sp.]|nr:hypothetical protein [Methanospirillum sp.]